MKPIHLIFFLLILNSCSEQKDAPQATTEKIAATETPKQIANNAFQQILDAAKVNGVILIFDEKITLIIQMISYEQTKVFYQLQLLKFRIQLSL